MKYLLELELADAQTAFAEEVFGALSFVKKVQRITPSHDSNTAPVQQKLSDKYRGILGAEQGENLRQHIKQMRSEWNSI
jgi:phosphodiesterase/alkaline phosphatase D-like protein